MSNASARTAVDLPRTAPSAISTPTLLALGFRTAAALWGVGFVARLPVGGGDHAETIVPSSMLFVLLASVLIAGGWFAGRLASALPRHIAAVALVTSVVNLLLVGSVIKDDTVGGTLTNVLIWVPGSVAATVVLMLIGARLSVMMTQQPGGASNRLGTPSTPSDWVGHFAKIAAATTLLLLMVGGSVTGHDAGLAVVDWPNSEGYFMFLYPLSRMTGGIYYEHAHRLLGSLVGLTTVVLACLLQRYEGRAWVRQLGWAAVIMVIAQGIMGGLRVTGDFTLTTNPSEVRPSLTLAIAHGIFGQLFLATMVGIAVVTSRLWRSPQPAQLSESVSTDRWLTIATWGLLFSQTTLGALLRHLLSDNEAVTAGTVAQLVNIHVTFGLIATVFVIFVAIRAWGVYGERPLFNRFGLGLLTLIGVQLVLGLLALVWVMPRAGDASGATGLEVMITTGHQTFGAILLSTTAALFLWQLRLFRAPQPEDASASTSAQSEGAPTDAQTAPALVTTTQRQSGASAS